MHRRALIQTFCLASVIAVVAVVVAGSAAAAEQPKPPASFYSTAASKALEARHKAMARLGEPKQLSFTEQLATHEDGRRSDPNFSGTPSVQQRATHEDGRRSDPNIYGTHSVDSASRTVIEIVAPGGFNWADAGVGVGATLAAVFLALGAVILIRTGRVTKV